MNTPTPEHQHPPIQPNAGMGTNETLTAQQIQQVLQTLRQMKQQGFDQSNPKFRALVAVLKKQDLTRIQRPNVGTGASVIPVVGSPGANGRPSPAAPTPVQPKPSAPSQSSTAPGPSHTPVPLRPSPASYEQTKPEQWPSSTNTSQSSNSGATGSRLTSGPSGMGGSGVPSSYNNSMSTQNSTGGYGNAQRGYPPYGSYPSQDPSGAARSQGGYPSQPQYPTMNAPNYPSRPGSGYPNMPQSRGPFSQQSAQLLPLGPQQAGMYSRGTISSQIGQGTFAQRPTGARPYPVDQSGGRGIAARPPVIPTPATHTLFAPHQIRQLRAQIATFKCIMNGVPVPPDHLAACQSPISSSSNATMIQSRMQFGMNVNAPSNPSYYPQQVPQPTPTAPAQTEPPVVTKKPRGRPPAVAPVNPPPVKMPAPTSQNEPPTSLFNVHYLMNDREKRLRAKLNASSQQLSASQGSGNPMTVEEKIQSAQLLLLKTQVQCRYEVNQCLRKAQDLKQNMKPVRGKRTRGDRNQKNKRAKENTEKAFLEAVLAHSKRFKDGHLAQAQKWKKINRQMSNRHISRARKEEKLREQQEKERLRALKENDEVAYLKLLEQTKNDRLSQLLNQTEDFLNQIGAKVKLAKDLGEQGKRNELTSSTSSLKRNLNDMTEEERKQFLAKEEEEAKQLESTKTYYTIAHTIQEEVCQPDILVGGTLKPYQILGLQWLVSLFNNNLNGVLADEMGLGKTVQTISLITYLIEKKGCHGPFLIIVPLAVLHNWINEFAHWAPSVVAVSYRGNAKDRKALYANQLAHGKFNVVLTTYELIIRDKSTLSKIHWTYIIIDEGHRIKNAESKLNQTLSKSYHAQYRLLLTGTPLQNSLPELWSLLNFLLPTIFNSVENFESWFAAPFAAAEDRSQMSEEECTLIIHRLHKVLRPFLLRRLKKEVENQLPSKVERVLHCDMSAMQKSMYESLAVRGVKLCDPRSKKKSGVKNLNNTLMELRKICNHPYLAVEGDYLINDDMVRCAGKFVLLDNILHKLKQTGHKVLIFSQMTELMTILGDMMTLRNYQYLRLDGSTASEDRGELPRQFNAPDSPFFVFILSTRAGGQGLNLQAADTVIIFDSDWNPQMDLQAMDRAHRIGQKKEVSVFRLVTINSVEETILDKANHKRDVDNKIIQAGMFNNNSTVKDRREFLKNLLKSEQEVNADEEHSIPSGERLNRLISRGDEEFEIFQRIDRERPLEIAAARRAAGLPSPLPLPLMQEDELPEWLNREQDDDDDEAELVYGRGLRTRGTVNYDVDKLTKIDLSDDEGQEEGEYQEAAPRRQGRATRKKRKRSSEGLDDEEEELAPRKKKQRRSTSRKKKVIEKPPLSEFGEKLNRVWNAVRFCQDESGRERSFLFIQLPSRQEYPNYYTIIREPIDLEIIKNRIASGHYQSADQFKQDMELLFGNACRYNVEGSQVYNDALCMKQVCLQALETQFGSSV